jgi:hypothetical protein
MSATGAAPGSEPSEEFRSWSSDKLQRKMNQEWDMAGLAHRDSDPKDAARHTELARKYAAELHRRASDT